MLAWLPCWSRVSPRNDRNCGRCNQITKAAHIYKASNWVAYDRQFRRDMLAQKDLYWSVPNACLYNKAFTGRAKSIPRCLHCLGDDHTGATCPLNPSPIVVGWLQENRPFLPSSTTAPLFLQGQPRAGTSRVETYRNFNGNHCRVSCCHYLHSCSFCRGPHPVVVCPTATMGQGPEVSGRGRSTAHSRPNQFHPYLPQRC